MPEYLSPGVYVEEIDAGPKPIEGVSTSTAGAIGVTARGPTQGRQGPYSGKPELVTSFAEFTRKFGGYLPEPSAANMATATTMIGDWWKFPLAVKAFFDNGGQRLYVKRVVSGTAVRAATTLGTGVVSEVVQNAVAADTDLRLRHLIGIDNGTNLTLVINGVPSAAPVTVASYTGSGTVALTAAVGQDLLAGRDWVVVSPRVAGPAAPVGGNPDQRLRVFAKSEGAWGGDEVAVPPETGILAGTGVSAQIRPMLGGNLRFSAGVPVTTTVPGATVVAAAGPTPITVSGLSTFAANDIVEVAGQQFTVSAVAAGPPATITVTGNGTQTQIAANAVIRRVGPLNAGATFNITSPGFAYVGAMLEFDDGQNKELQVITAITGNQVTVGANLTGRYTEDHRIRIIEAEVLVRYRNRFAIEQAETFSNLRFIDDGTPNYFARAVNDRSVLATLDVGAAFATPTSLATFPSVPPAVAPAPERLWVDLIGGRDNLNVLAPEDFIGADGGSGNRTGIQSLEDIDEVSICLVPGIHSTVVHDALISHCEILKDRFAILDAPGDLDIEGIRTFREPLDTKYAALYYPWLQVRDPSLRREIDMAPSAHMAGIYARVDVARGVHKAPANEVIRGITRIAADVTKREQDMLNPRNINVLRF